LLKRQQSEPVQAEAESHSFADTWNQQALSVELSPIKVAQSIEEQKQLADNEETLLLEYPIDDTSASYNKRGIMLRSLGRIEEAIDCFTE
jgi:hypothetical protein